MDIKILPNNSGIYKIICIPSQKFYLGSAESIYRRCSIHRGKLRKGTHHSPHLLSAYKKYGEHNFIFKIVEHCNVEDLLTREQHYLDVLMPWKPKIGYNINKHACSGKNRSKSITLKNFSTGEIKTWESQTDARKYIGHNHVSLVASGKMDSVGGWGLINTEKHGSGGRYNVQITLRNLISGEIKTWNSCKEASKEIGGSVNSVRRGISKRVGYWCTLENYDDLVFSLKNTKTGEIKTWYRPIDARKYIKCCELTIRKLIKGDILLYKGWVASK